MKRNSRLFSFPFFLFLLPLFFVMHGYAQNTASITGTDVLKLSGGYLLLSGVLFCTGLVFFRQDQKAALFTFVLLFVQLFFGAIHDGLKLIRRDFALAKYTVLLPLLLLLLMILFVYIRKSNGIYKRFFIYLNVIFLLLLLMEVPAVFKSTAPPLKSGLPRCDSCNKPDVYLLIADEYADSVSLAETMHFNNNAFLSALRSRDFYVVEGSKSAYNFTPFAVASLFQMGYLPNLVGSNSNQHDINVCQEKINHGPVLSFFKENGYAVKNFSLFTVDDQPAQAKQKHLVMGADLIKSQTFTQRLQRDLGYHLATTLKWQPEIERHLFYTQQCNDKLISLLQNEMQQRSNQPRFVYTHLLMPHYPYYFDKNGVKHPLSFFAPGYEFDANAYVEYLQYSNNLFLELIDSIRALATEPPVIIFMGDHGFREYSSTTPIDKKYYFMNMNAVFLPNKNYGLFYPGMSGVNQFRTVFNAAFGQHLPMLKDSSRLLQE